MFLLGGGSRRACLRFTAFPRFLHRIADILASPLHVLLHSFFVVIIRRWGTCLLLLDWWCICLLYSNLLQLVLLLQGQSALLVLQHSITVTVALEY